MRTVRSEWSNAILVCKKCSKKLGGGFGPKGKTGLAKVLRAELAVRKGRKGSLGIIDVKCLGVCPRGAVTVVDASAPGEWLLIREGLQVAAVIAELGLGTPAPTEDQRIQPVPSL